MATYNETPSDASNHIEIDAGYKARLLISLSDSNSHTETVTQTDGPYPNDQGASSENLIFSQILQGISADGNTSADFATMSYFPNVYDPRNNQDTDDLTIGDTPFSFKKNITEIMFDHGTNQEITADA